MIPLDSEFESVKRVLETHLGSQHPITLKALADAAGLFDRFGRPDRRRCERILELFAERFPFVVVGGSEGMYIAATPDDLNHEMNSRISRIKNIAIGWRTRKQKALRLGWRWENGRFTQAPRQAELFDLVK